MTPRQQALNRGMVLYFGSQEKANEFLQLLESIETFSQTDRVKELNKFKRQWQKELKQVAGSREPQTY